MTTQLPEQLYQYKGNFTGGTCWPHFEHREGDIFVCTPPRRGTTWTQAICAPLVFQTPDLKLNPAEICPWFDAFFAPPEASVSMPDARDHRRIIKIRRLSTRLIGLRVTSSFRQV